MRPDLDAFIGRFRNDRATKTPVLPVEPSYDIPIPDEILPSNRINHPHDSLSLRESILNDLGPENATRLDMLREAVTGVQRDMLMVLDDYSLLTRDPEGSATGIHVDIFTIARNNIAITNDTAELLGSLKGMFPPTSQNTQTLTREAGRIIIHPLKANHLPITINMHNRTDTDIPNIQNQLREERGESFAGYVMQKPKPNEILVSTRLSSLKRNPADFYENLRQADLNKLQDLMLAIDSLLPDITLSEIAVLAEGSATVSAGYNDIDLRVAYAAHPGNNIDANVRDISEAFEQAVKARKIKYFKKRETSYRRVDKTRGVTAVESVAEPSFEILVPETGCFIQVVITGEQVKSLKGLYQNPDRTDLPVVINSFNRYGRITAFQG